MLAGVGSNDHEEGLCVCVCVCVMECGLHACVFPGACVHESVCESTEDL